MYVVYVVSIINAISSFFQLGSTAVGISTSEGVVLAVEKRVTSSLMEPSSIEKILEIDTHIGEVLKADITTQDLCVLCKNMYMYGENVLDFMELSVLKGQGQRRSNMRARITTSSVH